MIMAKDTNNVRELIKDIKFNLPYLHFKGKLVVPLDVTINAQTDKLEILYICLNNGNKYTREVEQWFLVCGSCGWEKYRFRDAGA